MTQSENRDIAFDLKAYVQVANGTTPTRKFLSQHQVLLSLARQFAARAYTNGDLASIRDAEFFVNLLKEAVEQLPSPVSTAMTVLYGLAPQWRQRNSAAKRKKACSLLGDETEWETFRDRHELAFHEEVRDVLFDILTKVAKPLGLNQYEYSFTPEVRAHFDWSLILRSYLSIVRCARAAWISIEEKKWIESRVELTHLSPVENDLADAYLIWRLTELSVLLRKHVDQGLPWVLNAPSRLEYKLARTPHLIMCSYPFDGVQQAWLRRLYELTHGEAHFFVPSLLSSSYGTECVTSWRIAGTKLMYAPDRYDDNPPPFLLALTGNLERLVSMLETFIHGESPGDEKMNYVDDDEERIHHRRLYTEVEPFGDMFPIYNDKYWSVQYGDRSVTASSLSHFLGITGGAVGTNWRSWTEQHLKEVAENVFGPEQN